MPVLNRHSRFGGSPRPISAQLPMAKFLAVGIDFGTTFSGVSWAYSLKPNDIGEIRNWPGHDPENGSEDQVPTEYDYDSGRWGFQIETRMKPLRWFKLLLLHDDEPCISDQVRSCPRLIEAREQIKLRGISGVEVVARYLKQLWDHTYKELGQEVPLEYLPIRVAITVPAIWPYYAQEAMREAARRAGILRERDVGATTLELVQEPEAAGRATLFESGQMRYPNFKVGSTFVVCDAGGGTVDIISYEVTKLYPLELKECVQGEGELAGAFLIDDAFARHLATFRAVRLDKFTQAQYNDFFLRQWERAAKQNFREADQVFTFRPPEGAMKRVGLTRSRPDTFELGSETMKMFFAKSLTGIRSLVHSQVTQIERVRVTQATAIILVGGLGSSKYISRELEANFGHRIQRPQKPWSAVARGAVIRLLGNRFEDMSPNEMTPLQKESMASIPRVVARRSRMHYGVVVAKTTANLIDITAEDAPPNTYYNPEGIQVTLRMNWFLRKDQEITNRDPVQHKYVHYSRDPGIKEISFRIKTSSQAVPPIRPGPGVKDLCGISCDLDVPWRFWRRVSSSVEGYKKYEDLSLAMTFDGEPMWKLRVGGNQTEHDVRVQVG